MPRATISGSGTPTGIRSMLARTFVVHAQDGDIRRSSDQKARGHHHSIVPSLGVDVLDAVDALDDGLQRLGDQLYRVLGPQPVGAHVDVDHRHRDLRLLLARQRDQRHQTEHECRKQEKRHEG